MKKNIKSAPIVQIELLDTLTNIYDEEAHIFRDHTGVYFRCDADNRQRVNAASYNHAVNILYKLGYHF